MEFASYMEACTEIVSPNDIVAGFLGVEAQERGDVTWVYVSAAVSTDVLLFNLDEEYIDSALGILSRAELVNAHEQDPVIGKVLNFKKKGKWPLLWEITKFHSVIFKQLHQEMGDLGAPRVVPLAR